MSEWPDPSSHSAELYARAKRVLPGGVSRLLTYNAPYPFYVRSGAGSRVTDVDGTVRVDHVNNFASLIHGHAHPEIVAAVTDALGRGTAFALPTALEVEMAELLAERYETFERVRYCNTGTEAVMLAIKAARAATGRPKIAKFEGGYHGMYDYAEVSLDSNPDTWGNDPRSVPYARGTPQGVTEDVVTLPFNHPEAAERILRAHAEGLAGILVDVAPSYFGMIPISAPMVEMLHRVADETGAVLIADEVISLRLGYRGGAARFGLRPQLTTAAKLIGGGFPVACVAGRAEVMEVFSHEGGRPALPSSGTFTANPIGLTAGLTAMRLLTEESFERLETLGTLARSLLTEAFAAAGVPGQVTGVGSMFSLHMTTRPIVDHRSAYPRPEETAAMRALQGELLRRGHVIAPKGSGFISTATSEADLESLAEATSGALRTLALAA
ncbi:aspartate aminotransferase family protein [Acuticoccus sp.]|uniref:aspartate aminotransferase family protein n=1 Tax=Acuticoccus sp. TaxID=1904378 RepID=UPI003B5237B7